MAQAAPTKGDQLVFPNAIQGVRDFVEAREEFEFAVDRTETWLQARVGEGFAKYGTHLETFNGRDALKDAWEEAADLVFYLEQKRLELPLEAQTPIFVIADLAREALLLLTEQRIAHAEGIRGGR